MVLGQWEINKWNSNQKYDKRCDCESYEIRDSRALIRPLVEDLISSWKSAKVSKPIWVTTNTRRARLFTQC